MGLFDFITGDDFRSCLDGDYQELGGAMTSHSWKSAHVLAGSIVEAVLVDYLVASDYQTRTGRDPLRMDLKDVVSACEAEGIIGTKTGSLCSVIREYRNLIHPGRVVRLQEKVTESGAKVAQALVEMIVDEVSHKKQATYGSTAEQIFAKIERDPAAAQIVEHLLRDMKDAEIERLLLKVIPDRTKVTQGDMVDPQAAEIADALKKVYRHAFALANKDLKTKVALQFVKIVKEESGHYVVAYADAFIKADAFAYLNDRNDLSLIKDHVLSRLSAADLGILGVVDSGFARLLDEGEMTRFVDHLVRAIAYGRNDDIREKARAVLEGFWIETSSAQDAWVKQRLNSWIPMLNGAGRQEVSGLLQDVMNSCPPF